MNIEFPAQFAPVAATAVFVATVIVRIGFAAAVTSDADRLRREDSGPLIAGPFLWMLATLLGGVFVAGLYWAVNHSALSRR